MLPGLDGSGGKESDYSAGDTGSVPGEGSGNPLQCSCLENSVDRGAWQIQSRGSQRVGHEVLLEGVVRQMQVHREDAVTSGRCSYGPNCCQATELSGVSVASSQCWSFSLHG